MRPSLLIRNQTDPKIKKDTRSAERSPSRADFLVSPLALLQTSILFVFLRRAQHRLCRRCCWYGVFTLFLHPFRVYAFLPKKLKMTMLPIITAPPSAVPRFRVSPSIRKPITEANNGVTNM